MIKLIATDIDGTLLTETRRYILPEFFREARRLIEAGIPVATSSGRQYDSMRRLFAPIAGEIYYMCENGAVIYGPGSPGKIISTTPIDRETSLELCHEILARDDSELLISGANMSYVCPKGDEIVDELVNFVGNNVTVLRTPEDMPEDFLKISARTAIGAAALEPIMAPRWSDKFSVAVAGKFWLDFTISNKGTGIAALCGYLGISPADVMAFGDNFNDVEILDLVGHPYVMDNGAPPLLERYPNHCARVDEVLAKIK